MDKKEEMINYTNVVCQIMDDEAKKRGTFRSYKKMNVQYLYIDIPSIFPLLQDIPKVDDYVLIKPSDFIKEMSISTEERRQRLLKFHRVVKCPDVLSDSFKVIPDIIIFQNTLPGESYTVPFTIVNITERALATCKKLHSVIGIEIFNNLHASYCGNKCMQEVAQSDERKDYQHKITINSDNEALKIPIFAIGPRPLLDFPNEITLPSIPVKIEAEKIIVIRNTSTIQVIFRMHAPAPFTIEPRNGVMTEGERIRLKIKYKPLKVGPIEETLTVSYESGEVLGIKLKGYAEELSSMHLSQTFIAFEDTYMGLTRQETCEFRNTSNHILRYAWKMYSSDAEDNARWETLHGNLDDMRCYQEKRYNIMEYHNVCSGDGHRTICERLLQDEVDDMEVQRDSGEVGGPLHFGYNAGGIFEIIPEYGEIWPNATVTFTIIFKPEKALSYSRNVFFDISGTSTRTKLILRGTGLGPSFELNINTLDAQNIFLCASHTFEIVAHNKGIIPGIIGFANKKWDFGAEITFNTRKKFVKPGAIASFVFEFHSRIQGHFLEEIHFLVQESHEIIQMVMKGNVICPLLAFDTGEVNFGAISLGVPYLKKFNLLNNCQVPIEFSCFIRDDGHQHAVTCEEFIKMEVKELPENPKEFHVTPLQGTVPGYSSVTVTIILIANTVQHLTTLFILNMWGSNNYKATLSVEYDSNIPNIICKTPELHVNGCFINYPYSRTVILKNQSEFSGVILVDMQKAQFCDGLKYTCPTTDFFIQAYGEIKVAITIVTIAIGESRATLAVRVFGSRRYALSVVDIVCSGIGPTISFQPDVMDFENISTLNTYSAPITISNDSAIPATVEIINHGKVCKIDKALIVIEPNQVEEITVSIYLKVACRFHEKLKVKVEDGDIVYYAIKAIATGTSILCTPKLEPELNLGYLYTNKPFALDVTMKNESPFNHKICWTRLKYIKSFNTKDIPVCNIPSIFSMTPIIFDLSPGNSMTIMIEGNCAKPNIVEEDFYCHAIVGKDKKTVIMSYILKANFVTPAIEKSLRRFHFRQDLGVEVTVNFLEDTVTLFNNSKLSVTMDLSVPRPYYIKTQSGLMNLLSLPLEYQEETCVTITYQPVYADKRCFKDNGVLTIQYVGLPTTDQIPILGEVNFPTIQLVPDTVDFGCLPIGTNSYILIQMKNISPLKVNYFTEFSEGDFKIEYIELQQTASETKRLTQLDIIDTVSHVSEGTRADILGSGKTVSESFKCGYKEHDDWVECQMLFCSCKPNQYRNIKSVLHQLLLPSNQNQITDALQKLAESKGQSPVHQVFDINPTAGFLDPYECKVLTIAYHPIPNTQVSAKLKVNIQDGETEILPVVGKCANLTYTLDEYVEFNIQLFCEISERTLKLRNTSYEAVLFKVYHDQADDMPSANGWPQSFYNITPKAGLLEPNNSIIMNVKYFPGCPGEFTKNVVIKIGHFKPTIVRLHGFAVFPQIYIPNYYNFATARNEEDPTIGYNAIATLSLDYLLLMKEWRVSQAKLSCINTNVDEFDVLLTDDWEVVVYHNLYPTERDINLAIERYLASAVTLTNPSSLKDHAVKNRAMFIPRFSVQAYHLDFGLVVINSEAQLPVPYECYVHYDVDLRLLCAQSMLNITELGLTLVFKKTIMHPGDVGVFHIIFKPTALIFTEPDMEMSYVINFSIAHGPIIPMKISAYVTTPKAHTSTTLIDFGDVQCGMAVRQSMIVENSGRVLCKWRAKLIKQAKKSDKIFLLRDTTGVLQPGESTLIYITFQPECDGPVRSSLKITIDDNPDQIDIKLKGVGIEGKLTIEEDRIQFDPALPYSYHEKYISIKNNGAVPIEMVFTDFDTKIEEEKIILRLLMKYYNSDVLYIPPRTPGSPLPEPLTNFYNFLQENAMGWLMQTKDNLDKVSSGIHSRQDDSQNSKSSEINKNKTAILAKLDSTINLPDTFYEKREEIIADYIKLMRDSKSDKFNKHKVDPIAQTIAEAKEPEPPKDPTDMREGVLLIFTGAPLTNALEVANRASIVLKLPVVNVNSLIYEALLRNDTLAAIKINQVLDETYESLASLNDITIDPYDALIEKMDLVVSGKSTKKPPPKSAEKASKSRASSKSKSSKSSKGKGEKETSKIAKSKASTKSPKSPKSPKTKKTKSGTGNTTTLLNIPAELLIEAMQNSLLTYEDGVIIESLDTHFITGPTLVLSSILKAIGNIRHIQIITLLSTWDKYVQFEDEQKEKQRQNEEEELAQKIIYFENMDTEQFEQMTPEDIVLFKKHIILKRKEATKNRVTLAGRSRASRLMLKKQKSKKLMDKKSAETGKKSTKSEKKKSNSKTDKASSKPSKSKKSAGSKSPTNDSRSKKSKKKAGKGESSKDEKRVLTEEEKLIKMQFDKFEAFYFELLHFAEFWNRKISDVIKPYTVPGKKRPPSKKLSKSKSSKGSAKASAKKPLPPIPADENAETPIVEETEVESIDKIQIGIPCWIFDNTLVISKALVAGFLKQTRELDSARHQITNSKMDKPLVESTEYFSILHQPEDHVAKNVSDVFRISDAEPLQDPSDEILRTSNISKQSILKSRKKMSNGNEKRSTKAAIENTAISELLADAGSILNSSMFFDVTLTPRAVIRPNESLRYKIIYHPTSVGDRKHIYTIETVMWPKKYEVSCFGTADIPRILNDPNVLFAKNITRRNTTLQLTKSRVFIHELDLFDFGYMLIRQTNNDPKLLMKDAHFTLINKSLLPCIAKIYLNNTENDVFSLDQTEITIAPNSPMLLKAFANPHLEQSFDNQIYICVKDNPEVYIINVRCAGCLPEFSVQPKMLSFDRVLYETSEKRTVRMQNDSPVPLRWSFTDTQAALQFYTFAPKSGYILGYGYQLVEFSFTGVNRGECAPVKLNIEVVDDAGKMKNPLITEHLEIRAEVIDVTIEYESHITFGVIKGKVETIIEYHMLNHAKYDVEYIFTPITVPDNSEHRTQKRAVAMTKVQPARGILKSSKPFVAHIHIMANNNLDLQRMPVMSCNFMETCFNQLIAHFDLLLSGRIHLSTFELCPQSEILFGRQLVESEITQNIAIKNIGKFSFTYKVISLATYNEERKKMSALRNASANDSKKKRKGSKKDKRNKKSRGDKSKSKSSKTTKESKKTKSSKSKSTKSTKSKSKNKSKSGKSGKSKSSGLQTKIVQTTLDAGVFTIISSTGTVQPGETVSIKVISKAKDVISYEEIVLFFVSESCYTDRLGRPVLLKSQGQIPYLNLENFDEIFNEHYVVEQMSNLICPEQMACNLVFVKDEKTLYFNKVCINTDKVTRIKITNASVIHTEVFCKIISDSSAFKITPNILVIEGYNSGNFTITFRPTAIETFSAMLEVSYNSMSSFQAKSLAVKLVGDGYVPEIVLFCPLLTKTANVYELHYDSVMVGDTMKKSLEIENVGALACQVLCSINENSEFVIVPPKIMHVLKYSDTEVLEYKDHLFEMKVGEKMSLVIEYRPITEPGAKSKLKIHVFNNPYEIFTVLLNGESYKQDIKLENISIFTYQPVTTPPAPTPSKNRKASAASPPITYSKPCYELNFGYIRVNRLEKKFFKITNTSDTHTYKFELDNISNLLFIPAVGHLRPKATKEIIVTFLTKQPVMFEKEILSCRFYKIDYLQTDVDPLSWDERQNFVVWMPAVSSSSNVSSSHDVDDGMRHKTESIVEDNTDELVPTNVKVKTLEGKLEPQYEEIVDSSRNLNIFFTVTADYSRVYCSVTELSFEDTLLFEKRNLKFTVENKSTIPLVMNWQVIMDVYPKRISSDLGNKNGIDEATRPQTCIPNQRRIKRLRPAPLAGDENFVTNSQCTLKVPRPSTSRSSLFASSGGDSTRTRDSWCDADILPFTVHPQNFAIPPSENQIFTVTFAPSDVYKFTVRITSDLKNMAPDEKNVDIAVFGTSLLPLYYFNIEPTDYLVRRNVEGKRICDDLVDENTRIIEFEAIGIGYKIIKTFTVINPTGEKFAYRWIPHHAPQLSHFRCHTVEGVVTKGKMVEAVFSFLPQNVGVFEEYFTFRIDRYDLKALFLLVGMTREPCVFYNTPSVLMKPTVIGINVCHYVELKNNENIELGFKFIGSSLWEEKRVQRLIVEPKAGTLQPHSETKIKITYTPLIVGERNFYLKCEVEKRSTPCILCVITNCFAVEPRVLYVDYMGTKVSLDPLKMNTIELDDLPPLLKYRIPVFIENIGQTGFYFNWTAKDKYCMDAMKITFNDKEGYVKHTTMAETSFSISALKYFKKRRTHVVLEFLYGPSFPITVICSTSKISYKFSFEEYNFGPCLVQLEKSMYYKINLQFTNMESQPTTLDYAADQLNFLTVCFKAVQVNSKATETIKIYFHPMLVKDYDEHITFYVNSKVHKIRIRGSGVPINLELDDYRNKYIDLGSPYKGSTVQKTIKMVNNGLCSISVAVNLYERLPTFHRPPKNLSPLYEFLEMATSEISVKPESKETKDKKGKNKIKSSKGSKRNKKAGKKSKSSTKSKKKKGSGKKSKGSGKKSGASKGSKKKGKKKDKKGKIEKKTDAIEAVPQIPEETQEEREKRLLRESVQIIPKVFITIQPKKTAEFVMKFTPCERIAPFSEKIFYEIQDHVDALCMFKGMALGSDYYLERDYLTFTNIIRGCKTDSKLTLFNTGDIGGRYKWTYDKFDEAFSIYPMEGYISTNTNVVFTITFTPEVIQCATRARLKCTIDHFDKALNLLVNGSSSDYPNASETKSFICPVRTSSSQSVTLENTSCGHWTIHPVVTLPVFETPHTVSVDPQSSSTFEVIYKPTAMTKDVKDIGMLILHIPNGQALLYQLTGEALRPEAIPIEITIPCKQEYVHVLPVKNWLRIPQLFQVINEVMPSTNDPKTLYKLTGNEYIQVPGLVERNYNWTIYVINEGKLHFKTKIRHGPSGEYIVYELFVTVTKSYALDEIHLSSCVRHTQACKLKFENPIGTPVDVHFVTNASILEFPEFATLRPYSEYFLEILYTPLVPSDSKMYAFEATTRELGVYPYVFHLTASPAIPEKIVTIVAPLGYDRSQKVLLENLSELKADFTAKLDDSSTFFLPPNISIGPKEKTYFEINFEPSTLGAVESKLLLTSPVAGEYIYPLKGIGILPKPQGPFFSKSGGTIIIQIRNPFFEQKNFAFETNSANFEVKPRFETIKSKQTYKIVVNVVIPKGTKQDPYMNAYPLTGKLTVTCNDTMYSDLKWIYYLQAE